MPRHPQPHANGAALSLAIHLGIYCALAGCFACGFYQLMQPRRIENPGLAAYKPLPGTVVNYTASARPHEQPVAVAAAAEPASAAIGAPAEPAPEAKKSAPEVKPEVKEERPKRQRTARPKEHRDYMADYQPMFGYRPWN